MFGGRTTRSVDEPMTSVLYSGLLEQKGARMVRVGGQAKAKGIAVVVLALAVMAVVVGSGGAASTPKTGGTLYLLGNGDVDYMDPNVSYYTVGQFGMRMWSRYLMQYPSVEGKTTQISPDLAVAPPKVTDGGRVYSFTIRKGAQWDTTPPRQVTAADAVLGLKRSCNPVKPSAALADYEFLVAGLQQFCDAFAKVKPNVGAIAAFIKSHNISGVSVSPKDPLTVVYRLTHPASYFPALMGLGAFAPAPVEYLKYLPISSQLAQNTISDGPYKIASYNPGKSIDFVRNPAWKASSDPLRHAYVDEIKVDETVPQASVQQQLQTNTPTANAEWGDSQPPPAQIPGLIASKDPNLILGPTLGMDPFLIFNFVDPNENGAMKNLNVRKAIEYAIDRSKLVQVAAGPQVSPPMTHVLPPGVAGYSELRPVPVQPDEGEGSARREDAEAEAAVPGGQPEAGEDVPVDPVRPVEGRHHRDRRRRPDRGHLLEVPARPRRGEARRLGHLDGPVVPGLVRRQHRQLLPADLLVEVVGAGGREPEPVQEPEGRRPDRQGRDRDEPGGGQQDLDSRSTG